MAFNQPAPALPTAAAALAYLLDGLLYLLLLLPWLTCSHSRSPTVLTLSPLFSSPPLCALPPPFLLRSIFKTSAVKGDGLTDGLDWLVAALREGK